MILTSAGVSGMLIIYDTLFQCWQRSDLCVLEFFCFSASRYTSLLYVFCYRHYKSPSGTFFGQEEGLVLVWYHIFFDFTFHLQQNASFPGDKAWCLLFLFSGEGLRTKLDISHFPFRFFLLTSVLPTYIWTVFLLAERFSGYFWCVHSLFSLLLRAFAFFDI